MFNERDVSYIKALKRAGESVDDFIGRIESACQVIKGVSEDNRRREIISECREKLGAMTYAVNETYDGSGKLERIKVEFYM